MEAYNALVLSLPTRNSTLRMRLWRALKETGCGVLRDGVYALPAAADTAALARMEGDIRSSGGFAMTLELKPKSPAQLADLRRLFDRSAEYGELVARIREAKASLPRLGARRAQTAIRRLERALEKLARIDFFPGEAKARRPRRSAT
jgi:DNA-binding transcriptional regulator PaaX